MSTTGLAASPGTDVDPTCSMRSASSPNALCKRTASAANVPGQAGSYGAMMINLCDAGSLVVTRLTARISREAGRLHILRTHFDDRFVTSAARRG